MVIGRKVFFFADNVPVKSSDIITKMQRTRKTQIRKRERSKRENNDNKYYG